MTATAPPADRPWHGPLSLVGVVVGLLVSGLPIIVSDEALVWLLLVPPVVGLVLLLGTDRLRQLGIGLLASGIAYPVGIATYALTGLLG